MENKMKIKNVLKSEKQKTRNRKKRNRKDPESLSSLCVCVDFGFFIYAHLSFFSSASLNFWYFNLT